MNNQSDVFSIQDYQRFSIQSDFKIELKNDKILIFIIYSLH
jgi:hypothetical protein